MRERVRPVAAVGSWDGERLVAAARDLGVDLDLKRAGVLLRLAELVLAGNAKVNLTAATDPDTFVVRHLLDSLTCLSAVSLGGEERMVDIGTGAGLPGLVLAVAVPGLRARLVDGTAKKVRFVEEAIAELGLTGVEAVWARAEDLGHEPAWREKFDLAVARAVARLDILGEYCLPLVKVGGRFLAMKGPAGPGEAALAAGALAELGGEVGGDKSLTVPGLPGERHLLVVDKVRATPGRYPRKVGIPEKRPLAGPLGEAKAGAKEGRD